MKSIENNKEKDQLYKMIKDQAYKFYTTIRFTNSPLILNINKLTITRRMDSTSTSKIKEYNYYNQNNLKNYFIDELRNYDLQITILKNGNIMIWYTFY